MIISLFKHNIDITLVNIKYWSNLLQISYNLDIKFVIINPFTLYHTSYQLLVTDPSYHQKPSKALTHKLAVKPKARTRTSILGASLHAHCITDSQCHQSFFLLSGSISIDHEVKWELIAYGGKGGQIPGCYTMKMEGLKTRRQQLKFSLEEDCDILVHGQALEEGIKKGENNIIGKLHVECFINKDVLRTTMAKAWKTLKPFEAKELSSNTFIFSFDCPVDMQRIMHRRPWLFDSHLLFLKPFDGLTPLSRWTSLEKIFGYNFIISLLDAWMKK